MNEPASEPSTALALPEMLDRPIASLTAVQAVQRIRVCVNFARSVAEVIEMQIREAAWIVRNSHPERGDFERFVAEQGIGDTMTPARAWRYAGEWELLRARRPLRELAHDRPRTAIGLLTAYSDARDEVEMDEIDAEIQGALGESSKRKRDAAFREICARARAAGGGRDPADVERIAEMEAQLAAAEPTGAAAVHPAGLVNLLVEAEQTLASLAERLEAWHADPARTAGLGIQRANRGILACDMASGSLERILDVLHGANGPDDLGRRG